jgi:stage II sporulation protein AA (anti-sigma F factor antagonist)
MHSARLRWHLQISREERDGVSVFTVRGRLGTLSSGDLIETLAGAIRAGARRFVIDLSDVDYVSSAGLLALQAVWGRLLVADGDMVLCGLTEPVRTALELAGLLDQFTEVPSRQDALARLAGPTAPAS